MFGYLSGSDYDLFSQLERMRREMDAMVSGESGRAGIRSVASGSWPAINVGASPDRVDVWVFAAGLDSKSLDVTLQQNLLTISGERRITPPEGAELYRRERFDGGFRRVLTLPEDVDPDRVDATYRNGVLHVTVHRREEVKPRRIEIS